MNEPHPSTRRLKILLTEGSSMSARQTIYLLGPHHTIDILDSSSICVGRFSRFVRRLYRCPPFARQPLDYLRFLVKRLRAEPYDLLLPTHDQVYLLSRVREQLSQLTGLAIPDFQTLERMQSKAHFVRLLEELGIPHPPTRLVSSAEDLRQQQEFPCYVKLAFSTAGTGTQLVQNREQMQLLVSRWQGEGRIDDRSEILVQKPACGTGSSVIAVFQHGRMVRVHCFEAEALGVGGSAMMRISCWHPEAVEHIRRIGEHLQWHGPVSMDYLYDKATRQPWYVESNPRIGEGMNGFFSGIDICQSVVQLAIGERVTPQLTSRPGVRTHQGFLVLLAKGLAGGSRRAVLSEALRMISGQGVYRGSENEITRSRLDWTSAIPSTAVGLLMLGWPRAAHRLVRKTVADYALDQAAAREIRSYSEATLAKCFE